MKTFNAAHLAKKPAEVFAAARKEGAIIQQKRTNGEVIEEFVLLRRAVSDEYISYGGGVSILEDIE